MDRNETKAQPPRPPRVIGLPFRDPPMAPRVVSYESTISPSDRPRRLLVNVTIERPGVYSVEVILRKLNL